MKYLLLILGFVCFPVLAESQPESTVVSQESVNWVVELFNDMYEVVHHTPTFIERAFAYIIELYAYLQFYVALQTVEFAYGVAQALITNIGLDSLLTDAISRLPSEYHSTFQALGFLKAITIICEAAVVRFVLNFMGW
ncbi:DUF2523 domain-containing protein [Vibrio alginolyticus]|uniref:DUF2523 family protein n=1 Tax=Vibrio TaxID=662 RepID=UPI00211A3B8F|nr:MULTISPECIES: DUF2523 family protein [Vibrio]ELB2763879.1 DUF2523 domain-containing protein [Vibrio alginolyticus]MCQ9091270.1 DUF2523 domain-containing protein [Vibrio alginolyticus]MCR9622015.1 DUF2523 domain-containing protein [Vibrio sp. RM-44-3]